MKRWQSTGNWVKSVSYSSISYASVECKCFVFSLYRDCTAHTVYTFSLNEAKRIESINCSLVNLINNYIGFPFHLIPVFVCCVYILCIFLLHEWTRTNLTFSIVNQWLRYSLCSSFAPIIYLCCEFEKAFFSSLKRALNKNIENCTPTRQEWNTACMYAIDS